MRTAYYIFFLCLLFTNAAFAQVLKGIVVDARTGKPVSTATVVNKITQQSTYTNEGGEFTITARTGQDVVFSFLGYLTVTRTMPPTLGTATIHVEMQPMRYELDEVVIRSGLTKYQRDSIWRRETYARPLARQKVTSIMSPVSLLADRLNKHSKQVYKFQKSFNYWEQQRFIDSRYSPELVVDMTGMAADSVGYFMNAYPMPGDYARTATDLELKMWIRTNYKEWQAKPRLTDTTSIKQ